MALGDDYATTAELRREFSIGDVDDNDELALSLAAASEDVTLYCGRDFNQAASTSTRTFQMDGQLCWVDDISTTSGLVVKTDPDGDGTFETTWTSTEYQLEPLNGVKDGRVDWPYESIRFVQRYVPRTSAMRPLVQVEAQWGWTAVPSAVKKATLILAARYYKRRDSADGVLGGFEFGAVRVGTRMDPDVERLLSAYRRTQTKVVVA